MQCVEPKLWNYALPPAGIYADMIDAIDKINDIDVIKLALKLCRLVAYSTKNAENKVYGMAKRVRGGELTLDEFIDGILGIAGNLAHKLYDVTRELYGGDITVSSWVGVETIHDIEVKYIVDGERSHGAVLLPTDDKWKKTLMEYFRSHHHLFLEVDIYTKVSVCRSGRCWSIRARCATDKPAAVSITDDKNGVRASVYDCEYINLSCDGQECYVTILPP